MTPPKASTNNRPSVNHSLRTVPTDRVKVSPQPRKAFDPSLLKELAGSIASVGLQHPPLCRERDGVFEIIDGERRFRACSQLLGWTEIPILVVLEQSGDADVLARALVCNLQRADLTALERALGIERLMTQANLTAEAVAALLGLSNASVARSLSLLKLPESIRALVANGTIPADSAYQLSTVSDPARQAALAAEVAGKRLTRDGLARKLKSSRRTDERRSAGVVRCTAVLAEGRSVTLAGRNLSLEVLISALEELLARARKSKSQGLTLETFVRTTRDLAARAKESAV